MEFISKESLLFLSWLLEITATFSSQAFNTYCSIFIPLNVNKSQSLEDFDESFCSSESIDSELCLKIFLGHRYQY